MNSRRPFLNDERIPTLKGNAMKSSRFGIKINFCHKKKRGNALFYSVSRA